MVITYYSLQFLRNGDTKYTNVGVTIPVSTFTIDFVFENCFLSTMTPYVDSRDGPQISENWPMIIRATVPQLVYPGTCYSELAHYTQTNKKDI